MVEYVYFQLFIYLDIESLIWAFVHIFCVRIVGLKQEGGWIVYERFSQTLKV